MSCAARGMARSLAFALGLASLAVHAADGKVALVPFRTSPFPYQGEVPEQGRPFLDVDDGERRGHATTRGGVYWEDPTYSDRRVLIAIPPGFDLRRRTVLVVFLHGNEATLERDVHDRQQVPRQLAESGLNAVLVAPQFAVDARDSSAGRFWEPGVFAHFLDEAAEQAARVHGNPRLQNVLRRAPVVVVAYSGGYHAAAYALAVGGAEKRIHGVVLLDALYGQEDKFAGWLARRHRASFFLSTYTESSRTGNETLQRLLGERDIRFRPLEAMPKRLVNGTLAFLPVGADELHQEFVSHAWTDDPLIDVFRRITGYVYKPAHRAR